MLVELKKRLIFSGVVIGWDKKSVRLSSGLTHPEVILYWSI